jgi:RNA-directed DNA polymerase
MLIIYNHANARGGYEKSADLRNRGRKFAPFHKESGRSAHQAVAQAQRHIADGYKVVVDIDLERFFDRVNHDSLMARVAARVSDNPALKLFRAFLHAEVMEDVSPVDEGTPQGGPLSPILSNLVA